MPVRIARVLKQNGKVVKTVAEAKKIVIRRSADTSLRILSVTRSKGNTFRIEARKRKRRTKR